MTLYPPSLMPVSDAAVRHALIQMYSYIEASVPIHKTAKMPRNASGALVNHLSRPWEDYIIIRDDLPPYLELIVLAHELGHLENSRFDRSRFSVAMLANLMWKQHGTDYLSDLIVEEEMIANRRGRLHIQELLPDLTIDYDLAMETALGVFRTRGWIKPTDPYYAWLP